MRFPVSAFLTVAFPAIVLAPGIASATLLAPPAVYEIAFASQNTSGLVVRAAGSYSFEGSTASAVGQPLIEMQAHTVSTSDENANTFNTAGSATLAYFYGVDGPQTDVLVPLFITVQLSAQATRPPGTRSLGTGQVQTRGGTLGIDKTVRSDDITPQFSGTLAFNQYSGRTDFIKLIAGVSGFNGGTADAFVDPFVYIDPDWLASNPGYSLVFSPGIANVAAVPAPPALGLLATAVGGLLLRLRKQRSTPRHLSPSPVA